MPDGARLTRIAVTTGCLLSLWTSPAAAQPADTEEAPVPPYISRGNQVEATYTAYVQRLERYQGRLRTHLEADAPDLAERLTKEPPTPVAYGYLLVPDISVVQPAKPAPPRSGAYNWPWTNKMLDTEQANLAAAEQELDRVDRYDPQRRRSTYETLVTGYPTLEAAQRRIDSHLKHNRFWQKVIHGDRKRFDRQYVLHNAVVEREQLARELREGTVDDWARDAHTTRIAELERQIEEGMPAPVPPRFIEVVEDTPTRKRLRVPLYTDIPDARFVAVSVEAIEEIWRVDADGVEYRLEVDLRTVTPEEIYAPDAPPATGTHINLDEHVTRFPTDGGVLTTGSNRTYAIPGRFVAVGPAPISNRTVAHEFGHILGFTDRYIRAGRDLGRAGFDIIEIVPDGRDLMAATASGVVRAFHFEALIAALAEPAAN